MTDLGIQARAGAERGHVVGFVGLGNMGIPMTRRLIGAGYHVRGFDASADARANFAALGSAGPGSATATEAGAVGDGADAVILMLPDSDIVERVVLGRLAAERDAVAAAGVGGLVARLAPGTTISGRSGSTENKWPNYVLTEQYDAGFSVRLMVKDIKLALGIEHATGVPSVASEAVVATWEAALADLPPDADHTAIARWLNERTAP